MIPTRTLGAGGPELPVLCFGAYALGGGYWGQQDPAEAVAALELALELGMHAIDTAPVYGLGSSEQLVGRALRGRRERALVLTKVGIRWDDPRGGDRQQAGPDGKPVWVRRNSRPESVRAEIDQSLARLGIERIDLIQVHARDPEVPVAETMGALLEARAQGKVAHIGVSNYAAGEVEEARRALAPVPLASHQIQYSLLARGSERELLPQARALGVGVLAYAPLDQGLLSGKVGAERRFAAGEGRARRQSFEPVNRARVNALLERVARPIAQAHQATLAQVVLACTLAEPGITSLLVGARSREQVRENAGAARLALAPPEREALRAGFAALRLRPAAGSGVRSWLRYWLRRAP